MNYGKVVTLAGGVGGARMSHGIAATISAQSVSVIVNTADDFDHLGLRMCTDLDTVLYTLANREGEFGWGVRNDSRVVLDSLAELGHDPWFLITDRDFATHIYRTSRLQQGAVLSEITSELAKASGVDATILPMTNQPVATMVDTPDGTLDFQTYFVAHQQRDHVLGVTFRGIESAMPAPGVLEAIAEADLIVIAPSNPIVSIGPILTVPGIRAAFAGSAARKIAVSPIIGGKAVKGPADRMLQSLGHESSALGVARMYADLIDTFVIDEVDRDLKDEIINLGIQVVVTDTMMSTPEKRASIAQEILSRL